MFHPTIGDSIFEHNNWSQSEVRVTRAIFTKNGTELDFEHITRFLSSRDEFVNILSESNEHQR